MTSNFGNSHQDDRRVRTLECGVRDLWLRDFARSATFSGDVVRPRPYDLEANHARV